ncbi:hypothetical protein C6P45_000953 [Maudiozyma exigua]|uniref:Phospholipid/glycerol acyltransferase domain-containing protein n=1 Tax=Maudiozyma exigua TaxID=34358 RepID=A0A9P6W3K9_MAUEX|nr:hypothetical protein C6P45_000953 [Kazachstania exigua]
MEKYTNWRDKGTGIAPFQPPTTDKESIFFNGSIVINFVNLILYIVRCVLLLPLVILTPFVNLKILFLTGLTNGRVKIDFQVQGVKRSVLNKNPQKYHLQKGQIYIVNYCSVISGVILQYITNDNNSIKYIVPNESTKELYELTLKQFIDFSMSGKSLDVTENYGTLIKEVTPEQLKKYTWIIFGEGTCSNGKSILPFQINKSLIETVLLGEENSDVDIIPITIKVNNTLVTPLGGSKIQYLMRLVIKYKCIAKVRIHQIHKLSKENDALDSIREELNDGDKYKLVSKTLDIKEKRKFADNFCN